MITKPVKAIEIYMISVSRLFVLISLNIIICFDSYVILFLFESKIYADFGKKILYSLVKKMLFL